MYDYNKAKNQKDTHELIRASKNLTLFHATPESVVDSVYQHALSLLKDNPELKPFALEMGRKKYSRLRESGALTIYDESAISNDINAAI